MHIFLKHPVFGVCPKCRKEIRPHTVCWNCGYYKGEEVINVLEKLSKKEKKKREREIAGKKKEERNKPLSMSELSKNN